MVSGLMSFSAHARQWKAGISGLRARDLSSLSSSARGAWTRHSRAPRSLQVVSVLRGGAANYMTPGGVVDYYELLGIDDDASAQQIKAAYRTLAKVCHPDHTGENDMCILLNEAYTVLMDENLRAAYNQQLDTALQDEEDGYTAEMLSKWMVGKKMAKNADPNETRGVFVDEITCIGCKQCMWCSPATFRIEEEHGRSRVFAQWLDTEDNLQAAIDSCPVSCIHWVDKEQLPALEYVMQKKTSRPNVGIMMAGQGGAIEDVWQSTAKFLKEREAREEKRRAASKYSAAQEAARRKAAEAVRAQQDSWWGGMFTRFSIDNAAKVMAEAIKDQVLGSPADEVAAGKRVGFRKRANRWATAATGSGRPIPLERSLVPLAVKNEPWRKWSK